MLVVLKALKGQTHVDHINTHTHTNAHAPAHTHTQRGKEREPGGRENLGQNGAEPFEIMSAAFLTSEKPAEREKGRVADQWGRPGWAGLMGSVLVT